MMKQPIKLIYLFFLVIAGCTKPQLENYNVVWTSQSINSSESMPCGGGDIGLNVWAEEGDVLFYLSQSGTFDENNCFLKLGRVRLKFSPNPFNGTNFRQELKLGDGYVTLQGEQNGIKSEVKIWVDVFHPVVHVEIESSQAITTEAIYESWRSCDRELRSMESLSNSYKWAPPKDLKTKADQISFAENAVLFYHRNNGETVFDATVRQQKMELVKDSLYNPLKNLTFGGLMEGENMVPAGETDGKYMDTEFKGYRLVSMNSSKNLNLNLYLHTAQTETISQWIDELKAIKTQSVNLGSAASTNTLNWWKEFWQRSFVYVRNNEVNLNDTVWQIGRNYQLFRYMLACNSYGEWPTKFNGGLFTVDPVFTDSTLNFTPDFRKWGGGTFTAQNQRLVYFPMLKNGDFDMMKPQFDFYNRILKNAELRSKIYWKHEGASFTEQIENFGLPSCTEYGWNRPDGYDVGMEYNNWLEYEWETALEFCYMILQNNKYTGADIAEYLPLVKSCPTFFEEHYKYLAEQKGESYLDSEGRYVFYPGSACETYKRTLNSTTTIAGLQTVTNSLLELPDIYLTTDERNRLKKFLSQLPSIGFKEFEGHKTLAPAWTWERINNTEAPQLYPVYPWGIYGVGKPDLETAINTWKYDPDVLRFKSHVGWKQYNIFAACMGLTDEAAQLTLKKMADSGRRFPAFWGPGFDWVPDHNWGGAGMIGMQEMLMQTVDDKIYLFPAWPADWDVHFKLFAPKNTIVEAELKNGKVKILKIIPESRAKDLINCYQTN